MKDQEDSTLLNIKKSSDIEIRLKEVASEKRVVKTWTSSEDEKLVHFYNQYPKKWNKISEMMGNRNENQCLHRFRRLIQATQNKKIWSPDEDRLVLEMYQKYGNNWKIIALALKTKNGKQIRERFINKLDPQIKKQQWTKQEDIKIVELLAQFGSKWSDISKLLPGRPQNRIKNRFYSHIQKNYDIVFKHEGEIVDENYQDELNENQGRLKHLNFLHFSSKKNTTTISDCSDIYNKENKQESKNEEKYRQSQQIKNSEELENFVSKKYLEDEWRRQRSLQQIQEPNDNLSFRGSIDHEDLFYFEEN